MIAPIGLLVGIFCVGGVWCATDFRNQTIRCAFHEYSRCYSYIASLGADFSSKYDETGEEINATCQFEPRVTQCVTDLLTSCNSLSSRSASLNVTSFIHRLCTEKSTEYQSFLNSSRCYNQFQDRRLRCVKEFSNGNDTDAKSLCCSNLKTQECLRKDMVGLCSKDATDFQSYLMDRYRNPHNSLCEPYFQNNRELCNRGIRILSALAVLLATSISLLLQKL